MIDFRYHLVSLVSVFLALAVGIVLGAGPLKGELGQQLSKDVSNLRDQLSEKEAQVRTQGLALDNRDAFTRTLLPGLAAGQLRGERVVVVTLPGVEGDVLAPLTDALQDAGATVTGRVELRPAWTDPAAEGERQTLVRALVTSPPTPRPRTSALSPTGAPTGAPTGTPAGAGASRTSPGSPSASRVRPTSSPASSPASSPTSAPTSGDAGTAGQGLASLLAGALLTDDRGRSGQPDQAAADLLDALAQAGLVAVDGDLEGRADEAVLVVPAVPADGKGSPSPTPAVDPVEQWAAVALALDTAGRGAVVTGPASSGTAGGVVAAVRAEERLSRVISTVDTGGTPMGDLTTVLALREQLFGGVGRYGFVGSVDGPLPTTPAAP